MNSFYAQLTAETIPRECSIDQKNITVELALSLTYVHCTCAHSYQLTQPPIAMENGGWWFWRVDEFILKGTFNTHRRRGE